MIYLSGTTRHPDIHSLQQCVPVIHSRKIHFLSLHFSSTFIIHEKLFSGQVHSFSCVPLRAEFWPSNTHLFELSCKCTVDMRARFAALQHSKSIDSISPKMGVHPQLATQIANFSCTPLKISPFILTLEMVVYVCVKVTTL